MSERIKEHEPPEITEVIESGGQRGEQDSEQPGFEDKSPTRWSESQLAKDEIGGSEIKVPEQATERSSFREDQAVEAYSNVEGLRPEKWAEMDETRRLHALQEGETTLAAMQGREPATVVSHPGGPGEYGHYNGETHQISFGSYELEHGGVNEAVNTLAHEGRHAYQQWAVDHPGFDNASEVETWRENMKPGNYIDYRDDPIGYAEQPIEADAFRFEQAVRDRLDEEGR